MRTLRFQLQIRTGLAGGYALHVRSPRGEWETSFVPPLLPDVLDRPPARDGRDLRAGREREEPGALAGAGERLFAALFQGEILRLYERSLDLLEGDREARLRIEIQLDPRDPRLASLQHLPWELLRQPGTPEAMALSRRRPLVRYLMVPRPVYAAPRPTVLRILAVRASPAPSRPLDLALEMRNLREAVGSARDGGRIEVVEPEAPTLAAVRQALLETECHVLHFMGHGGSAAGQEEEGALCFEDADGGAFAVSGTDLVNKLDDFPTLRLVVLNACRSAVAPGGGEPAGADFDPFAGVATSLVLGGLPAVVAMRLPISDAAAIAFSRAFYRRLAAGDPVDAAMAEGRQAVHSAAPAGFEWATPVLFMRTPNGELYPEKDLLPEEPRPRWPLALGAGLLVLALAAGGPPMVRDLRTEQLVAEGVAFAKHEQWREARKVLLQALKLAPKSAEVQSDFAAAEEKVGFVPTAGKSFRQAVRLQPDSAEYLYRLGSFLNRHQSYQEAEEKLRSALRCDPSRADAYAELATAEWKQGRPDEAREAVAQGLRLDPVRPELLELKDKLDGRAAPR
jgi:hypothetical protein